MTVIEVKLGSHTQTAVTAVHKQGADREGGAVHAWHACAAPKVPRGELPIEPRRPRAYFSVFDASTMAGCSMSSLRSRVPRSVDVSGR